eukprot:3161928-Prymnesium_polylepis.1
MRGDSGPLSHAVECRRDALASYMLLRFSPLHPLAWRTIEASHVGIVQSIWVISVHSLDQPEGESKAPPREANIAKASIKPKYQKAKRAWFSERMEAP